ncbi:MAG: hypothetical protein AB7T07_00100 [Steroidobacteraceae bacterium]
MQLDLGQEWLAVPKSPSGQEQSLIEYTEHVQANLRLSCQIKVTATLQGLAVRIPESQH